MPYDHAKLAAEVDLEQRESKKPWRDERFGFEQHMAIPDCCILKDPLTEIGPYFRPVFMEMPGSLAPSWLNIERQALIGSKRTKERLYGGDFFSQVELLIDPNTYLVVGVVSDGLSSGLNEEEQAQIMTDIGQKTRLRKDEEDAWAVMSLLHSVNNFTGCDTSILDYLARTKFWSSKNTLLTQMLVHTKDSVKESVSKYSGTDPQALQLALANISANLLKEIVQTQSQYLGKIRTSIFSHLEGNTPIPWADSVQTVNINMISRQQLDEGGQAVQISATLAQSMADTVTGAEWRGENGVGRIALITDHNLPLEKVFSGMCKEFAIDPRLAREYYLKNIYPMKVGTVYASGVKPNAAQPTRVMAQYDREVLAERLSNPQHHFTTVESTDGGIYTSRDLSRPGVDENTFFSATEAVLDNEETRAELTRNPSDDFCIFRNKISPK